MLSQTSTEQLVSIYAEHDREKHSSEELASIYQTLRIRGVEIPMPRVAEPPAGAPIHRLPVVSNAVVRRFSGGKTEVQFPSDGQMTHGRFEFTDWDDVFSYLTQTFAIHTGQKGGGAIGGSISRRGRYQRVDDAGRPIVTFGDPILDMITNRHGLLIVKGEVHDVWNRMIRSGTRRSGIRSLDLVPYAEEIGRAEVVDAARGVGKLMLLSCDENGADLASTNPSKIPFKGPQKKRMQFEAWRTNLFVYFSLGAYIETWDSKFVNASIVGHYFVQPGDATSCKLHKVDSDADAHDDYVDEWEWGTGIFMTIPDGVSSDCRATWLGMLKGGTVDKGTCIGP